MVKHEFKKLHDKDISSGNFNSSFVISNKWFPATHIDHYIAHPPKLDFIATGDLNDIHTYAWLNEYRKKIIPGDDS